MKRREFLGWALSYLAAASYGKFLGRPFRHKQPVTLLDCPDYQKDIHRDLATVMAADGLQLKGRSVLLKPNFVEFHTGRPINTHFSLIRNVAEACYSLGAEHVSVGEAAGHRRDPWYSVHHPSLRQALEKKTTCIDMNHGPVVRTPNRGTYTKLKEFYTGAAVMQADVVIGLPKLKTHHWVGVTLALKNMFGTLPGIFYGWPKNVLHIQGIEASILDIAQSIPLHYAIIDAITGMEGDGPILGTACQVGTVIMGANPLAVDAVGARVMGFDPGKVPYLKEAGRLFPGLEDWEIEYRGEHPRRYARKFACLPQFAHLQGGPFW
jgi:uncharacterized protein (DUF362 family)